MRIDPYKHKERYLKWKESVERGIPGLSNQNSDLIKKYLTDMEIGVNISSVSVKGPRGYNRLNNLKDKFLFFSRKFNELYNLDCITDINEESLFDFFSKMESGHIKKQNGGEYSGIDTYTRCFKAFWHWWQKVNRKNKIDLPDITVDLNSRQEKPKWVYLNEEQVKKLCDSAKYEYKVLIMFLYDSGIRSPTELINVKVSDLYDDCRELNIREETSKTFGRRIKLMLCSEILKEYVQRTALKKEDYLFKEVSHIMATRYLKRLASKLFGDIESEAGKKYSEITLYDFRHCSCCYWLPRYKSESALKYRFGWKKSDKIHYYSELLGMRDTISEDDLLIDTTKTELERQLVQTKKENDILIEKVNNLEKNYEYVDQFITYLKAELKDKRFGITFEPFLNK